MHQYLIDTEYATINIIDLIMHDKRELEQANKKYHQVQKDLKFYQQQLYAADMSDDLSPMQLQYEYLQYNKRTENLSKQEEFLISQIEELKNLIDAKSVAVSSLCGALLQIAKQGISIVHKNLISCPDGKNIGSEVLKNVIWQGRNQSMHYEDGKFQPPVTNCFQKLEASFGNEFSLSLHSGENFAQKIVIKLFGWNDYQVYKQDMISLLG
ncbi:hypothetical protein HCG51_18560 [Tolypothrix sp. PCC 7910]|uniref:hypothetical protein n=1 Tax=Tolypothrix sp. PCC 7910 TaxID=2099387 RepID=UPI001427835F|nr:hypothetical protein [Tolypothrix sp. PCC 7910]QIR38508.1 hypothetical protein HCG51_18560 [Tolypothrix sp. PCC 7910]